MGVTTNAVTTNAPTTNAPATNAPTTNATTTNAATTNAQNATTTPAVQGNEVVTNMGVSGVDGCDQALTDSVSAAFGAATGASSTSTACAVANTSPAHTTAPAQGRALRGRRRLADVSLTISSTFASADKAKAATATVNGQGFATTFNTELAKVDSSLAAKVTVSSIAAVHKDTTTTTAGSTTSAAPSSTPATTAAPTAATTATKENNVLSMGSRSSAIHAATAMAILLAAL